ncbi:MAG: MFS transporter [Candidatus Thermoplasmatota archaeon]|nr:MFS transporter [Candidatus Thermoplasmatota archaeon]
MKRFEDRFIKLNRSKRWYILLILVVAIFVGYVARMSISVALPFISREFAWDIEQQGSLGGILLGIFLIGYGISNIIFSKYIDIYGSKLMLSFSILLWSLSLLLGAIITNYYVILSSRFLLGISQGVLFPIASKITSSWFSPDERAKANSIYVSGGPWAVLFTPVILTPVITRTSWQLSFFLVFLMGLLLLVPVIFFITSDPKNTKKVRIEKHELDYSSILKEKQFQILLVGYTLMSSVWWGLSLWLPTYLVEAKGLELEQISYGASLPYVGAITGMYIGSYVSDRLGKRRELILFALLSGGLFIFILSLLGVTNIFLVIFILIMVFFTGQMAPPLYFTILQGKVSSQKMGSATGLMNGIGNGFGIIGPLAVGSIIALTGSYELGFVSLGIMLVIGGLSLLLYDETSF